MWPFGVVEREELPKTLRRGGDRRIIVQIEMLVLDGVLEPLDEDVVEHPPAPIHTDLHASCRQQTGKGVGRELTALIRGAVS